MSGYYHLIENIYRNGAEARLRVMIDQIGQMFDLYTPTDSPMTRVYGTQAQQAQTLFGQINGLLMTYEYTPVDTLSAGKFVEGFLFALNEGILKNYVLVPGCTLKRVRELEEGDPAPKVSAYQVMEEQELGLSISVIRKWRVMSVGQ